MKPILQKIKNDKIKAIFNKITIIEYILICIPFMISFISTKGVSENAYGFTFLGLGLTIGLGVMWLFEIRWRIIYFGILLFLATLFIIIIVKPWEYALLADRDSAIKVGIEAIFRGENPYKEVTSLGEFAYSTSFHIHIIYSYLFVIRWLCFLYEYYHNRLFLYYIIL